MKKMVIKLFGFEDFSLTPAKMMKLGDCKVKLHIYFKWMNMKKIFPLLPEQRQEVIDNWFQKKYQTFVNKHGGDFDLTVSKVRRLSTLNMTIPAKDIKLLIHNNNIESIWIDKVQGIKKKSTTRENQKRYFGVLARLAIQIEGQTKGEQGYEDKVTLVMARSFDEAERIYRKEEKRFNEPYINPDGLMVRWNLEEIIDVYDVGEAIIGECTEVFSMIHDRDMKKKYEWHPLGKAKERKSKIIKRL